MLASFDREDYEETPFDLVLFVLGTEVERPPWGRAVCSRVWNLDMECICETGDYARIAKRLCEVAGQPDRLANIEDFVDLDRNEAWLKYTVGERSRHFNVKVDNDWASDLKRDGFQFYGKDNRQATIWFYLDANMAAKLNKLSGNALVSGP